MIDESCLHYAELQVAVDRFVAAVDRVDVLMQALHTAGGGVGQIAAPLLKLDAPRQLELIAAVTQASVELARYRVPADLIVSQRAGRDPGAARWSDTGFGHWFARSRSFVPTTV